MNIAPFWMGGKIGWPRKILQKKGQQNPKKNPKKNIQPINNNINKDTGT